MSNYPSAIDTFNVIGTTNYMDEAGYVLHEHLNQHGSAVNKIQTVMGTNSGTSVLKDFTAGEFAVARNGSNVLRDTLAGGTLNAGVLGTPAITGGTLASGVVNNSTLGTPAITGGTETNTVHAGRTSFVARKGTPFSLGNMGTATTIQFVNGETQYGTLDQASCAISFGSASVGDYLTLYLYQDASGDGTITFAGTTVRTSYSVAPVIGTTASAINILGFRVDPLSTAIVHLVATVSSLGTL